MGIRPETNFDAERSKARIADLELGMKSARDGAYWRARAVERARILRKDKEDYGLLPHEEEELTTLQAMLDNGVGK